MKNIIIAILVLLIFSITSILYAKVDYYKEEATKVNIEYEDEFETAYVYFPRLPDIELSKCEINIKSSLSNKEKIEVVVEKLIEGPQDKNLLPVIPTGSKLNSVDIIDDTVYLDFSKEFVDNHPGGSLGEYNTIYSIVDSVMGVSGLKNVSFTIDGQDMDMYKGHLNMIEPF